MDIQCAATSDDRELDTLDCAVFGGLLISMNEAKRILKFKPPPQAFPGDFDYGLASVFVTSTKRTVYNN